MLVAEFYADVDFPERYFHLVLLVQHTWSNTELRSVEVSSAAEGCVPRLREDFVLACATCANGTLTVIYSDNRHNQTKISIADNTWERLKACGLPVPDKDVTIYILY